MRRSAIILSLCAILVATCGGCGLFSKKKKTDTYAASTSKDPYASPTSDSSSRTYDPSTRGTDSSTTTYDSMSSYSGPSRNHDRTTAQDYGTYSAPATMASAQPNYAPTTTTPPTSAARYHTVAKGDTLYAIARMYYGDQRRWRDVYEANRGDLPDPNMIRTGQRLLIP